MNAILAFLAKAAPFLALAVSQGVVSTSGGLNIESILADVNKIVEDANLPDNAESLIGDVQHILQDLQVQGIVSGTAITQVASGLAKFDSFVADVKGNQVGVIRSGSSLFGVAGVYAFIPTQSDVYKFLTDGTAPAPAQSKTFAAQSGSTQPTEQPATAQPTPPPDTTNSGQAPTNADKINSPNPDGPSPDAPAPDSSPVH